MAYIYLTDFIKVVTLWLSENARSCWRSKFCHLLQTLAKQTKGRQRPEQECDIRTAFQRGQRPHYTFQIVSSFRWHKTQVFLSPEGDRYRTRLTHTLEVAQIARTVARALRMNEDLTEAIAVGHDLGHTPFGHAGERALREVSPLNFNHNEQSVRVVERLEKNNQGLNLTFEVRDGILCHTGPKLADTPEGRIVRFRRPHCLYQSRY